MVRAELRWPMRSLAIGRLPKTASDKQEVKIWLASPSQDHQSVKIWMSAWVDVGCTVGGYVGQRPGSKVAPGKGSSAMCLSKLALRMRVRTNKCNGPQSCLPVRSGTSLVEGREEVMYEICSTLPSPT